MLENTESLLPIPKPGTQIKVLTVGFDTESLDEMDMLLSTLGAKPLGRLQTVVRKIHPATYIGQGKIEEIKAQLELKKADAVIVDVELSPNQLRNLEKEIGTPVLDRPGVILEIFSRHARTNESKTQVALARLQYLLPRLAHFWSHFERQGGGGTGSRGMGEKQIDVDRSLVKNRIAILRERLKAIERERKVQRAGRKDVLKVALVGYTNAGKSTLLNALTHSDVRAENKLFATLDASVRSLNPHSHPPLVAIDTVGFISNLPHSLVASFRSTLEELREADLLVHVVDASSAHAREQLKVTEGVLEELEVGDKPRIVVLNKSDLITGAAGKNLAKVIAPGAIMVSSLNAADVTRLRDQIINYFTQRLELFEILIPYSESKLESQLHAYGSVETQRHMEKGTFYRLRMAESWAKKLKLEKYRL